MAGRHRRQRSARHDAVARPDARGDAERHRLQVPFAETDDLDHQRRLARGAEDLAHLADARPRANAIRSAGRRRGRRGRKAASGRPAAARGGRGRAGCRDEEVDGVQCHWRALDTRSAGSPDGLAEQRARELVELALDADVHQAGVALRRDSRRARRPDRRRSHLVAGPCRSGEALTMRVVVGMETNRGGARDRRGGRAPRAPWRAAIRGRRSARAGASAWRWPWPARRPAARCGGSCPVGSRQLFDRLGQTPQQPARLAGRPLRRRRARPARSPLANASLARSRPSAARSMAGDTRLRPRGAVGHGSIGSRPTADRKPASAAARGSATRASRTDVTSSSTTSRPRRHRLLRRRRP